MSGRRILAVCIPAMIAAAVVFSAQRGNRWAMYENEMQDPVNDPADADEKTEFAFGRLRYRSSLDSRGFAPYARWGIDCNKSDRQFITGLRRLTRVHARSVEHIIDIDSDEIFDWPWIFGVSIGDWELTDTQATRLRKYFQRGGFMMVDDFHNDREWASFMVGVNQMFPNAQVIELEDDHPIFHVVYDLTNRVQIPGANVVHGPGYERGGVVPHWRGVLDNKGRVIIAACFNMDVGDAWEFADDPDYPERFASEAYRLGVNYVLYAMTH